MQGDCTPIHHRYWLALLFLGVMFGFAVYRHSSFAVWNDSAALFHPHDSGEGTSPDYLYEQFRQDPSATLWTHCLKRSFSSILHDGYRPLSKLWLSLAAVFFYTPNYLPLPILLAVGGMLGALAVSLFCVARRFVLHDVTALGAVLLVMGSPSLVGSSWVCVAGVQCVVPLLFCLSFLCYWKLIEDRHRVLCSAALGLMLLLGPWVREFFGLNAVLLMLLELRRTRRPTWIMGMAALGFLHALFPTALIRWLFLPELPLVPVYKLGSLSEQMGNEAMRWHATWHFIPLFPPCLWVCAGLEALLRFRLSCIPPEARRDEKVGNIEIAIQTLALPCWLFVVSALSALELNFQNYLGLALSLVLAALGMSRDMFLGCWFLLMYLPILRVFTEHVHFLYAIPPAAIILAGSMESLWIRLRARPALAWIRVPLACVFAVVCVDQALNIYGAYRVNRTIYGGVNVVADWFVRRVPARSAVVTNVIHGAEIQWHSNNHIDFYWTLAAGIPDERRALEQPAQLEELLAQGDNRKVYFLDVDFDYTPDRIRNHRHKYVHQALVDRRDLGIIHFSHVRFPFVDPLRYLVPRTYQPFLGAPDLENDFARKCSVDHPFRHEIYAVYHVYQVTGRRVVSKSERPVQLVQQELEGMTVIASTPTVQVTSQSGAFGK